MFSNDEDSLFINKLVAKNYNNCIAINTSSTLLAKFMSTDNENRYNEYISKIQKIASVPGKIENVDVKIERSKQEKLDYPYSAPEFFMS